MQGLTGSMLSLAIALVAGQVGAHEVRSGSLTIEHPWARATASALETGAVYMTIHNHGQEADRLIGARSDESAAAALHASTVSADGVARMDHAEGIDVPAGGEVRLAPGGLHVMLTGLKTQLFEGVSFPMTLVFEQAGEVAVEVEVQAARAPTEHGGPAAHEHQH